MNKRILKLSLLMLGMMGASHAQFVPVVDDGTYKGDVSGHTFFSYRPNYYGTPLQTSLWNRRALPGECGFGRECGIGGAIQIVPFGGRSTKSARLGRFFGFNGRNVLTVGAAAVPPAAAQPIVDINAVNFGIDYAVAFTGAIAFNPRQSVAGVAFEWRQYLGWFSECAANWWLDISVPVVRVRNDMRLTETFAAEGAQSDNTPANMTQAFAGVSSATFGTTGTGFLFGRIDGARKRTGVSDIELKIGLDALCTDCCYMNGYLGVLIPTSNRPRGVYVFEPILGYNRHVGLLFGSALCYDIWKDCDRALSWEVNLDSIYLFKGHETRSFDLKNRPWSRYLPVYTSAADAAAGVLTPGINVFTREMNITPRYQIAMNSALVYTSRCGFTGELGYNFWARQAEKASLRNTGTGFFDGAVAVASLSAANSAILGTSNLLSTIGNNNSASCIATGGTCTLVTSAQVPFADGLLGLDDIDLSSATHPATISNIVYGTLGYGFEWCVPVLLAVGGSYEFSAINTSLNRWTVWGKLGVSF